MTTSNEPTLTDVQWRDLLAIRARDPDAVARAYAARERRFGGR